ncbi:ribonuclease HII [Anaerobiospirillum succiniciproducens]|uniref:ribonuclease HII n=1 Tax=Anaerobiospirillum succiniciproducens TaxID=13335 RepID=UPI00248EAFFE|nr:ribonuclease HII [Anaerobiospirillum succiniciproducens]
MPPFDYPIDPVTNVICGVDEAGRGPLMGDVVAACVVLDHNNMIPGLNDSKKLTEKAREELAVLIKEKAIAWGIGRASPEEIDEFNILNATYIAMGRAYIAMKKRCNLALIDGNRIPKTLAEQGIVCETVVKGDSKVPEIAAASILAKTARDADMYELDKLFPQYHFAKHKGYPTAEHLEILQKLPLLDIYRMSFGPVKRILEQKATNPQD